MKAIIPKPESQHERDLIDNANHVAQSMMALFVYYLYTYCNNSPETCRKRFEGMTSLVYAPAIFGRQINDFDVIEWCKDTLNIDVSDVRIKTKINCA